MDGYVVVPGALALLLALSGVAALRTGRLPPWQRRRVSRTVPYGWGQLAMAAAFAIQACGQFADDPVLRSGLGVATLLGLLGGLVLLVVAQAPRRDR
ncbi:hypothetical protein [Streptomyces vietnamensis]|uniref:Uncharacterized protein n=1 Tax=Streptomyces vietnamensis TaxID=362257 RepID=A0A0B5I2B5_9ACTN|nr:hypothetical protein [Streptomyces vietnamensis]AJF63748.1 hypothetical protein SVTN_04085 [Streptomyces vietnamensis]